jgi:arylsulfatase A
VKTANIADNTIVIFVGDNGTSQQITSMFHGEPFVGGKGTDQESGIHVPMMIWWQGHISGGTVNNDLIDLTDFMPTLAAMAKVQAPTTLERSTG